MIQANDDKPSGTRPLPSAAPLTSLEDDNPPSEDESLTGSYHLAQDNYPEEHATVTTAATSSTISTSNTNSTATTSSWRAIDTGTSGHSRSSSTAITSSDALFSPKRSSLKTSSSSGSLKKLSKSSSTKKKSKSTTSETSTDTSPKVKKKKKKESKSNEDSDSSLHYIAEHSRRASRTTRDSTVGTEEEEEMSVRSTRSTATTKSTKSSRSTTGTKKKKKKSEKDKDKDADEDSVSVSSKHSTRRGSKRSSRTTDKEGKEEGSKRKSRTTGGSTSALGDDLGEHLHSPPPPQQQQQQQQHVYSAHSRLHSRRNDDDDDMDLKAENEALQAETATLRKQLQDSLQMLEKARSQITSNEKAESTAEKAWQKERQTLLDDAYLSRQQLQTTQDALSAAQSEIAKLHRVSTEVTQLQIDLKRSQNEASELKSEVEEYEEAVAEKDGLIKKLTEAVDCQLDKVEYLELKLQRAEEEFCKMEDEMKDLEDELELLKNSPNGYADAEDNDIITHSTDGRLSNGGSDEDGGGSISFGKGSAHSKGSVGSLREVADDMQRRLVEDKSKRLELKEVELEEREAELFHREQDILDHEKELEEREQRLLNKAETELSKEMDQVRLKELRLNERERELAELEKQLASQSERQLELERKIENELREKEKELLRKAEVDLGKELDQIRSKEMSLNEREQELKELEAQLASEGDRQLKLENELREREQKALQKADSDLNRDMDHARLKDIRMDKRERELTELEEELTRRKERQEALERKKESELHEREQELLQKANADLSREMEKVRLRELGLDERERELSKLEDRLSTQAERLSVRESELEERALVQQSPSEKDPGDKQSHDSSHNDVQNESLEILKTQIEGLRKEKKDLEQKLTEKANMEDDHTDLVSDLRSRVHEYQLKLADLQSANDELRNSENDRTLGQEAEVQRELEGVKEQLKELNELNSKLQEECSVLREQHDILLKSIPDEGVDPTDHAVMELQDEIAGLREKIVGKEREAKIQREEVEQVKRVNEEHKIEIRELETELVNLVSQLKDTKATSSKKMAQKDETIAFMQNEMLRIMKEKTPPPVIVKKEKPIDHNEPEMLRKHNKRNNRPEDEAAEMARVQAFNLQLEALDNENRELEDKLKKEKFEHEMKLKEKDARILQIEEELNDLNWEIKARKEADYVTLLKDRKEQKKKLDNTKLALKKSEERAADLESEVQNLRQNQKDLEQDVDALKKSLVAKDSGDYVTGLKRQIRSLKEHNMTLERKIEIEAVNARSTLESKNEEISKLEKELGSLRTQSAVRGMFGFGRRSEAPPNDTMAKGESKATTNPESGLPNSDEGEKKGAYDTKSPDVSKMEASKTESEPQATEAPDPSSNRKTSLWQVIISPFGSKKATPSVGVDNRPVPPMLETASEEETKKVATDCDDKSDNDAKERDDKTRQQDEIEETESGAACDTQLVNEMEGIGHIPTNPDDSGEDIVPVAQSSFLDYGHDCSQQIDGSKAGNEDKKEQYTNDEPTATAGDVCVDENTDLIPEQYGEAEPLNTISISQHDNQTNENTLAKKVFV